MPPSASRPESDGARWLQMTGLVCALTLFSVKSVDRRRNRERRITLAGKPVLFILFFFLSWGSAVYESFRLSFYLIQPVTCCIFLALGSWKWVLSPLVSHCFTRTLFDSTTRWDAAARSVRNFYPLPLSRYSSPCCLWTLRNGVCIGRRPLCCRD